MRAPWSSAHCVYLITGWGINKAKDIFVIKHVECVYSVAPMSVKFGWLQEREGGGAASIKLREGGYKMRFPLMKWNAWKLASPSGAVAVTATGKVRWLDVVLLLSPVYGRRKSSTEEKPIFTCPLETRRWPIVKSEELRDCQGCRCLTPSKSIFSALDGRHLVAALMQRVEWSWLSDKTVSMRDIGSTTAAESSLSF